MIRPFKRGNTLKDIAVPMADILNELHVQLSEYKALKEQIGPVSLVDPQITQPVVSASASQSSSAVSDMITGSGSGSGSSTA